MYTSQANSHMSTRSGSWRELVPCQEGPIALVVDQPASGTGITSHEGRVPPLSRLLLRPLSPRAEVGRPEDSRRGHMLSVTLIRQSVAVEIDAADVSPA